MWAVLPTSGARILARCLESWYVGEDTNATIGLRGVSGYGVLGGHTEEGCTQPNSEVDCTVVLKYDLSV